MRPPKEIDRWRRGERLTARQLNKTVDTVNRILPGIAPPRQIAARAIPGKETSRIRQFKVQSVATNYLVCRTFDGVSKGSTDILVALPYLLRQVLSRNDITYTYTSATERTADNGSTTETQVIVPSYVADDIIYAARGIVGGTTVEDFNDNVIQWLDLNVDGRAWAKKAS